MPLTLSTTMVQVSLISYAPGGSPNIWGVDANQYIYQYTGAGWTQMGHPFVQVSAAPDYTVWGLDPLGKIYKFTGTGSNPWIQIPGPAGPGTLSQISVAAIDHVWGSYWGANWSDSTFQYNPNSNGWNPLSTSSSIKLVSATYNAQSRYYDLWGLDVNGQVHEYNTVNNTWGQPIPNTNTSGVLVGMSATWASYSSPGVGLSSNLTVYGVDGNHTVFFYIGSPNWWQATTFPKVRSISGGGDGSVALIDTSLNTIVYDSSGN